MNTKTQNLMKAIIFMVIGILLCLSVIGVNSFLNWMIAISLIVGGVSLVALSLSAVRTIMTDTGLLGGAVLGLGVYCIPVIGGFDFLGIISMIMMVIGALLVVDAVIGFALRRMLLGNTLILISGAAAFSIGICLWLIPDFRKFAGLMLGIFFIAYAIMLLIEATTRKEIIVISKRRK